MEQVIYWDTKIVQYGKYFELSKYSKIFKQNFKRAVVVGQKTTKRIKSQEVRFLYSATRAKKNIKMLINENFTHQFSSFATLTFADNITDIDEANKLFKIFIRKLRAFDRNLKYLAVTEFQNRGAVHFHLVLRSRFIPRKIMKNAWSYGFYNLHSLRSVKHIALYLTKYMQKGIIDARLNSKKSFMTSKNLTRPLILKWLSIDSQKSDRLFPLLHKLSTLEVLTEFAGKLKLTLYEGSSNYLINKLYARKITSNASFL